MVTRLKILGPACALIGAACGALGAHLDSVTATFPAAADTTLYETNPDNNLGGMDTLIVGTTAKGKRNRALIRFDLAGKIPPGATITSVSLALNVVNIGNPAALPETLSLHRLRQAWNEGSQAANNGATASAGESTWNSRAYPDNLWSQPGAAAPDDIAPEASAKAAVAGTGTTTFGNTALFAQDVQLWLDHPEQNFGWLVLNENEAASQSALRVTSREGAANPPRLTIVFQSPEVELRITEFSLQGRSFQLGFDGAVGARYVVQSKDALSGNEWQLLTNLGPATATVHFVATDMVGTNMTRIYRLGRLP